MSLLEQQLKELQTKKAKIAYFREALAALDLLSKPNEGDESSAEARNQAIVDLTDFIDAQIKLIEEGKPQTPAEKEEAPVAGQFSADEVVVLKQLAARAQGRTPPTPPQQNNPVQPSAFGPEDGAPAQKPAAPKKQQDVLQFALAHRHLADKRVIVKTKDGEVGGTVRGILMPNIIVVTDTGHEAAVPPETIRLEQK